MSASPARTGASCRARRRPSALSGMSVRPVWRRSAVQSVSPWRTRYTRAAHGREATWDHDARPRRRSTGWTGRDSVEYRPRGCPSAPIDAITPAASAALRAWCHRRRDSGRRPGAVAGRRRRRGAPSTSARPRRSRRRRRTSAPGVGRPSAGGRRARRRARPVPHTAVDPRRAVAALAAHRAVLRPPPLPRVGEQLRRPRRRARVVVVHQGGPTPRRRASVLGPRATTATCAWPTARGLGRRRPSPAVGARRTIGARRHPGRERRAGRARRRPAVAACTDRPSWPPTSSPRSPTCERPARVIAPAGSGKTRVLTERLRHLDRRPRLRARRRARRRLQQAGAARDGTARTHDFSPHVRTLNCSGCGCSRSTAGARRPSSTSATCAAWSRRSCRVAGGAGPTPTRSVPTSRGSVRSASGCATPPSVEADATTSTG